MPQIEIPLPTDQTKVDTIEEYMVYAEGYTDEIPNENYDPQLPVDPVTNPETVPNPKTKLEFLNEVARRVLKDYLKLKIRNKAMADAEALGNTTFEY